MCRLLTLQREFKCPSNKKGKTFIFIGTKQRPKMKVNTAMPKTLLPYFEKELAQAKADLQYNNLQSCWRHLERAHIIGQQYPYTHSYVHWKMLLFGFRIKSLKEILGQIPRLFIGGIKSFVGHVPVGNTGGANVPPLKSMKIPVDIQEIIKANS